MAGGRAACGPWGSRDTTASRAETSRRARRRSDRRKVKGPSRSPPHPAPSAPTDACASSKNRPRSTIAARATRSARLPAPRYSLLASRPPKSHPPPPGRAAGAAHPLVALELAQLADHPGVRPADPVRLLADERTQLEPPRLGRQLVLDERRVAVGVLALAHDLFLE